MIGYLHTGTRQIGSARISGTVLKGQIRCFNSPSRILSPVLHMKVAKISFLRFASEYLTILMYEVVLESLKRLPSTVI